MGVNFESTPSTPVEALGESIQEYVLNETLFIGSKVFPILPVNNQAGVLTVHTREAMLKLHDNKRAPGGSYNKIDDGHAEVTYSCKDRGNKIYVDDSERAKYASRFDADYDAVQTVISHVLRQHEKRVADKVFNTTTFTGSDLYLDTTTVWSSATIAQVAADVNAAAEKVLEKTGRAANAMVMSRNTFNTIAALVVGSVTLYTDPNPTIAFEAARARVSNYFGLEVIVGSEKYDTKPEGVSAGSMSNIWSNSYVNVCRIASEGAGMKEGCLGRTAVFTLDSGTGLYVIDPSYRDNPNRSDVWTVRHTTDEVLLDANYGFLLKID